MELSTKFNKYFQKENIYLFLKTVMPYLALLAASLIVFWFWIDFPFITGGDDVATHLALITDLVYGFKHGFFYSTNHIYLGVFAYNAPLFYGMFPHYCAAILAYLGLSIIDSVKIVSILSEFIGAIFAYKLVKLITNKRSFALAGGLAFAFLPYKTFCFFFRFAWSEAIALSLIPIFFYALYRILIFDKQCQVYPFVLLIVSLAICIMTHPFSAILICLSGVIVLIFNIKRIIKKIKDRNWRFFIYFLISIILEIGLVFVFVFPMLSALSSGIYRVSYDEIMWTSLQQILSRFSQTNQFSGILNFSWLIQYNISSPTDSVALWTIGLILFPFVCISSFLIDILIKYFYKKYLKEKNNKFLNITMYFIRIICLGLILFVPSLIACQRIEVLMALSLYFVIYTLFYIFPLKKIIINQHKQNNNDLKDDNILNDYKSLLNDGNIYAILLIIILGFCYLYTSFIWEISPSFLYKGQFPFRFWGIVGFFIIVFLAYILKPIASRYSKYSGPIIIGLSCFLLTLNMGMVDKRLYSISTSNPGYFNIDEIWLKENIKEFGAQNEYLPQVIYDIYQGKQELSYPNSLADNVGFYIVNKLPMIYDIENYITPVFLTGSGLVEITYLNTPDVNFKISCLESGLLQIPQFYYEGYKVIARYENDTTEQLDALNVDGLLTIQLSKEGNYVLEITYPGTVLKNSGWIIFVISTIGVISFSIYGLVYKRKRKITDICNKK